MTEIAKAYVQIVPTTKNLGSNLKKEMGGEASSAGDSAGESFGSSMVAKIKKLLVAAGIGSVIKNALNVGSELQQNLGGTEAVWQGYADTIQKTAQDAYMNMGMSASEYMASANKIGALLQGSGVEQAKAVDMTAQAMQRAADVASVMGIETTDAMHAIEGAAKGNFTMMDNLGVAMNATTLEAYAASQGMKNFKYASADTATKTELAMKMFLEKTAQYEGNFARESEETLSGSINSVKAAWTDLLGNLALGQEVNIDALFNTISAAANNILPTITNIIVQLPEAIVSLATSMAPMLLQSGINMIMNLIKGFTGSLPTMMPMIVQTIVDMINTLLDSLPEFLMVGSNFMFALVNGIKSVIYLIIEQAPEIIMGLVDTFTELFPQMVQLGVDLFLSLIYSLPTIIERICAKLPDIITSVINALIDNIGVIAEAGVTIFVALIQELPRIINAIAEMMPRLIQGIGQAILKLKDKVIDVGTNLIMGLKDGIERAAGRIWESVKNFCSGIINGVKDFFGIHSPSTLFAEYGGYLMEGFANGISDNEGLVSQKMREVEDMTALEMASNVSLGYDAGLSMHGSESGLGMALASAMSESSFSANLYLDGKQISDSVTKYQRRSVRAFG